MHILLTSRLFSFTDHRLTQLFSAASWPYELWVREQLRTRDGSRLHKLLLHRGRSLYRTFKVQVTPNWLL